MVFLSDKISGLIRDVGTRKRVQPLAQVQGFHEWVVRSPKIETHVHVEAAVDQGYYESLTPPDSWSVTKPWERGPFPDLRSFIMAWVDLTRAVRRLQDFEQMAHAFVRGRVRENIRYTEAYFSPADFSFMRRRFSIAPEVFEFSDVLKAYVRGLKRALAESPGFEVRLIMDALWPSNSEERKAMLEALKESLSLPEFFDEHGVHYVVAVGLGGAESHHDLPGHIEFVSSVRQLGFKLDIHSGEGVDHSIHRQSVESLSPDRVSHGFSGIPNGFLFEKNIVMCPVSNLLLKTYQGPTEEHPVFSLLERGIPVSIGSDDPLLLGHNLSSEFSFLFALQENFSEESFRQIQKNTRAGVLAPGVCSRVL